MRSILNRLGALALLACAPGATIAEPTHGIAMYGAPDLPAGFEHLPQANPHAPRGGTIVFAETGRFDSLNPFTHKGRAPWPLRFQVFESLMGRSYDEPFTLYGLLAETIETGPEREWVEFTLREEARFSDGSPVTIEDVIWSFETLGTQGHPRYRGAWGKVAGIAATGPRSVRLTFNTEDRELPLIFGLRPILKKAQWQGRDFTASGVDFVPIGSAPYVIESFDTGRQLVLRRNPDYWGWHLGFNKGRHNFDVQQYDYYGDGDVVFEAFKAGEASTYREGNAGRWATQYDFPRVRSGDVVLSEIPHQRPTGINGLVMNTSKPAFADLRVRDAMIHAFNFEYINQTINAGAAKRIQSYFHNSDLGMRPGPATGAVRALLAPFADQIPPGALEGYALPAGDGGERNRKNLRRAMKLLEEAGWTIVDGQMQNADGTPFTFEILLTSGNAQHRQIIEIFTLALDRMGIRPTVTSIDSAQYVGRTKSFDFDMTFYRRSLSLSPGNEQWLYWGSKLIDNPDTGNYMRVASPAIDAMIEAILTADTRDGFRDATRALDRLLTAGRYVIPIWYSNISRVAHVKELHYPERLPIYGDWLGFQPEVWWWE